jgi:hypothetical protein
VASIAQILIASVTAEADTPDENARFCNQLLVRSIDKRRH